MERLLESLKSTWASLQLPLVHKRTSRDTISILGPLDDVLAVLDDSIVSVNTMAGTYGSRPHRNFCKHRLVLLRVPG